MSKFCKDNGLPILKCGKIILPTRHEDEGQIDILYDRAVKNGATVEIISKKELNKIEPETNTITQKALYSPNTSVVNPHKVLEKIQSQLISAGVVILFDEKVVSAIPDSSTIKTDKDNSFQYAHLVNCTGQHSDAVSKIFGAGKKYALLPFKGFYYGLHKNSNIRLNGLIYPVPDSNVPFLGVHSVKLVDGVILPKN